MMRSFILASMATVAVAIDPSFPGAAASAASGIASILANAEASSANARSAQNERANIANAVAAGSQRLTEAAASSMNIDALRKDAFILTHLNVRKQVHLGGCARNFAGCPINFSDDNGTCVPSVSYDGFCGPRNLSGFSVAQKEDFSFRCGVSWPCA